jgi:cytochrome c553
MHEITAAETWPVAEGSTGRRHPQTTHWRLKMKKRVLTLIVAAMAMGLSLDSVQARPKFVDVFKETYPNVADAATAKCGICHAGTDKKMRNDYGAAVGGAIGEKNEKDLAKVKAALEKVAKENPKWDEALKAGKLPK